MRILIIAIIIFFIKYVYPKIDRYLRFRGIRWHKKIVDKIPVLICFVIIGSIFFSFFSSFIFEFIVILNPNAVRTSGIVVSVEEKGTGRTKTHISTIKFYDKDGIERIVTGTGAYSIGENVTIAYIKDKPKTAVIQSYKEIVKKLLFIIPLFLIVYSIIFPYIREKIDDYKRIKRLKKMGFK
ncbi:hypothetical protein SAMN02745883_01907 [Caminicella sporogenes DSM 14501]|uniref:DUF3592 domain-containing protein n=1 Tax=Caminicella sporogenes DSM 14501 TaxID=1121266 RepID=A0A1M6RZF7_9FIRM|nr:DUF3592 domain-containing protein [Caminicella sporogenes]RKD27147.1 hypothetical protein BET04_09525 [Caminicella sporogenes]SHK37894.1 hypothetical protein SAMN02745883_01907 [Caminicella sporogenes DSM 14501]